MLLFYSSCALPQVVRAAEQFCSLTKAVQPGRWPSSSRVVAGSAVGCFGFSKLLTSQLGPKIAAAVCVDDAARQSRSTVDLDSIPSRHVESPANLRASGSMGNERTQLTHRGWQSVLPTSSEGVHSLLKSEENSNKQKKPPKYHSSSSKTATVREGVS